MNFNRVNNIAGWTVCAIATTVYLLTIEPTTSFWDVGEFIASSYKLEIPHPPGAPLFVMLGRLFIILFGDSPHTAAIAVNSMSAIMSGLTILFLFWTISFFARKLIAPTKEQLTATEIFSIVSASTIGALAYTFSDSFWFSAVEGEVYATSSLLTALVFWAIFKWERRASQPGADRWLIFIFFTMGLSIGVHLLNLLTIPALVMVYYFKKYKPTIKGSIVAFLIGCTVTGFVQKFIIQYSVDAASWFDIQFVNGLGTPFFTGFAFFFILVAVALVAALRYAQQKRKHLLQVSIWGTVFMLIGYSTYLTTMIRSNADPAIDMFNVDNPISLKGYLSREQYGDWPLLTGPDFTEAAPYKIEGDEYVMGKKNYEVAGKRMSQDWAHAPGAHFFPRMWDNGNERQQRQCYQRFSGLEEGETPGMADNMRYFVNYQAGWMYMRYFMWNFAGRQNDIQGLGNPRDSNWISGVKYVDNMLVGNQDSMPESASTANKAHNRLFMLPLALGILGMIYQYKRNKKDFAVNLLLFFFTGMAIVLYLNQSGFQPRERDYAYSGSFYAFAVWIGIGVLFVQQLLTRAMRARYAAYSAALICVLGVPLWMAIQEWDDHDRSHKTLALDMAKNILESCPENAMLFTAEDNDTYALWYAQEVENIRPDVRVMVSTLAATEWYMNQLRYKVNESAPFNLIFTPEQVMGDRRQVIYYSKMPGYNDNQFYDLRSTIQQVMASDKPEFTAMSDEGLEYNLCPIRKFSVPVNKEALLRSGVVTPQDKLVTELHLDLSAKNYFDRGDLVMLSLVATTDWKRPICFTSPTTVDQLGLDKYLRQEGMIYRLVPIYSENTTTDAERGYDQVMHKFVYGSAGKPGVYYDEDNRRRLNVLRLVHAQIALALVDAGQKEKARQVLDRFDKNVDVKNMPYGFTSSRGNSNALAAQFLEACYRSGHTALAKKVMASLKRDVQQQLAYYASLGDPSLTDEQMATQAYQALQNKGGNLSGDQSYFAIDILTSYQLLLRITELEKNLS